MCKFQKSIQEIMNACPACETLSPEAVRNLLPQGLKKSLLGIRVLKKKKTNGPRQRDVEYFVGFTPVYKTPGAKKDQTAYFETCSGWGATPTNPRIWSVGGSQDGSFYSVGQKIDEMYIEIIK